MKRSFDWFRCNTNSIDIDERHHRSVELLDPLLTCSSSLVPNVPNPSMVSITSPGTTTMVAPNGELRTSPRRSENPKGCLEDWERNRFFFFLEIASAEFESWLIKDLRVVVLHQIFSPSLSRDYAEHATPRRASSDWEDFPRNGWKNIVSSSLLNQSKSESSSVIIFSRDRWT